MREREKVMRGMHKAQTAQQVIDAIRIYYNFCREHQSLNKTPAEQAGIKLELQQNRIESLIRHASHNNRESQ
jgi:transposase InsO family protein